MNGYQYQQMAMRTATEESKTLECVGLGIAGEAGEVADLIKKTLYQGHELDREHLIKELGDVLWYVALGCETLHVEMDVVMQDNINKLKERYPEGFQTDLSLHRRAGDV